jgi:hypothetical protein
MFAATTTPRVVSSVLLALVTGLLLAACGPGLERSALVGRWEGTVPLPATRQDIPITYIFAEPALTVAAGVGPQAVVLEFDAWQIERVVDNHVLIHVTAPDGRVFATWARFLGDEEIMIWDRDEEETSAAVVRRVGPPGEAPAPTVPTPTHETLAGAGGGTGSGDAAGTGAPAPPAMP